MDLESQVKSHLSSEHDRSFLKYFLVVVLLGGSLLLLQSYSRSEYLAKGPQKHFLRVGKSTNETPEKLQVAISKYHSKEKPGLEVSLVGAIHIADKEYFAELNKEFEQYDAVLYELVAPKKHSPCCR